MCHDDSRGVGEDLNEKDTDGTGITTVLTHVILLTDIHEGVPSKDFRDL